MTEDAASSGGQGPVETFDAFPLRVAVWRRENESGSGPLAFYDLTLSRSYKTGEEWRYTGTLRDEDALSAAELLRQAWAWIAEAKRKDHGR